MKRSLCVWESWDIPLPNTKITVLNWLVRRMFSLRQLKHTISGVKLRYVSLIVCVCESFCFFLSFFFITVPNFQMAVWTVCLVKFNEVSHPLHGSSFSHVPFASSSQAEWTVWGRCSLHFSKQKETQHTWIQTPHLISINSNFGLFFSSSPSPSSIQ